MNDTIEYFNKRALTWDEHAKSDIKNIRKLLNRTSIKEGEVVLDVACGTGILTPLLYDLTKTRVIGVDISQEMIKIAKQKYNNNKNLIFVCEDFINMKNNKFDKIFIFNAYPHFFEIDKLKNALYDNLKENGEFIIFSDLSLDAVRKHYEKCRHVSRDVISLKEDFKFFDDLFDIILNEDDERHYMVIGKKKE